MNITRIEAGSRMSQAVVHGTTVYLAGQVGQGGNITEQTCSALAEVDRLLALAGTDKSRLLTTIVWLAEMSDFAGMNAVWEEWIDQNNPPTRATAQAALATPDYLVEFIITAAI